MRAAEQYDAGVVGSGQAGDEFESRAGGGWHAHCAGRSCAPGWGCINEGCTPTKTMVASARGAYLARRAPTCGVRAGPIRIDMERVRQRKRDIVSSFRGSNQRGIEATKGLDLIFGTARFTGPNALRVHGKDGSERSLSAERIFN